jgi:site-specific DNA-methyltransferase (adenine-specific)
MVRDYEVAGQIGLESTPVEYVEKLCLVFDEVWRILRSDGTCWVVLGDTYFGRNRAGRPKSLASIPCRFETAMTDRGWILRNRVIWQKPNAIPSSVKDRFTIDYEFVYFFVKNGRYHFSRQHEKSLCPGSKHVQKRPGNKGELIKRTVNPTYFARNIVTGEFRNKRCVWSIPTARCLDAHFATYPEELIKTPILAGCPEGGVVLDPFCGAGTTGIVCERLKRSFLGIELNPAYVEIAKRRIRDARKVIAPVANIVIPQIVTMEPGLCR